MGFENDRRGCPLCFWVPANWHRGSTVSADVKGGADKLASMNLQGGEEEPSQLSSGTGPVIMPGHLQVAEADQNRLSFGSFGSFGGAASFQMPLYEETPGGSHTEREEGNVDQLPSMLRSAHSPLLNFLTTRMKTNLDFVKHGWMSLYTDGSSD